MTQEELNAVVLNENGTNNGNVYFIKNKHENEKITLLNIYQITDLKELLDAKREKFNCLTIDVDKFHLVRYTKNETSEIIKQKLSKTFIKSDIVFFVAANSNDKDQLVNEIYSLNNN
jgi:hypothetical protein